MNFNLKLVSRYALFNQESFKLQNELYYLYRDIPNYLSCRPGKLTYHVYERIKLANEQSFTISYLHPGIFSVQGTSPEDEVLHTVSFGDNNAFPSCDCADWQQFKLPCLHFCAVFNNYPGWTWDMLSVAYKACPALNVDWTTTTTDYTSETPGYLIDNSTQTSPATLLSHSSEFMNLPDTRRVTETPQVIASQCRGLMQQLSKLQLAHHSRENLYRLRSDLKDLIAVFSSAPKQKQMLSPASSYVIQSSKGPGRPRKVNQPTSLSSAIYMTHQTVTDPRNVKPVTPKQASDAGERKTYPTRNRTPSSEISISKRSNEASSSQENLISTVYIVDSSQVLSSTGSKQLAAQEVKVGSITCKRAKSPSTYLKPDEKRLKEDITDNVEQSVNLQRGVSLEFPEEEPLDSTLMRVDPDSSVIDNNSINAPLEQVDSGLESSSLETSVTPLSLPVGLNSESFTATESVDSAFASSSTADSTNTVIDDSDSVVK